MVCGIAVNAIFILYKSARPKIQICLEKFNSLTIGIVQVQENICYSSAEYLKSKVIKFVNTQGDSSVKLIIIKGDEITNIDATVALVSLKTFLKQQKIYSFVCIYSLCRTLFHSKKTCLCWVAS